MKCDEANELIQLYLDNELDGRTTLEVRRHLEACGSCSRLLDVYLAQDRLLKEAACSEGVEATVLRDRILATISREARPGRRIFGATWLRIAAVVILAVLAGLTASQTGLIPGPQGTVYAAAAADHANHCSVEAMAEATSEPSELSRLVSAYGGLDHVPDLSRFGYGDPRGRTCRIGELEFLHVVYYSAELPPLSLFMRPRASQPSESEPKLFRQDELAVAAAQGSRAEFLAVTASDQSRAAAVVRAVAALR